jgi:hypothetical protein
MFISFIQCKCDKKKDLCATTSFDRCNGFVILHQVKSGIVIKVVGLFPNSSHFYCLDAVNDEDRTFACPDEQELESTPIAGVFNPASGKTVFPSYKIWTSFFIEDACLSGGKFEQQLTFHGSF